jgi:fatty acid desaturase
MKRVLRIVIGGVVIEVLLAVLAHFAPAAAALIRPVCWIVAVICLFGIVHALKHRTGHDRRVSERRSE